MGLGQKGSGEGFGKSAWTSELGLEGTCKKFYRIGFIEEIMNDIKEFLGNDTWISRQKALLIRILNDL